MGSPGSESDQVYLDLLGGWREAVELGASVLDGALGYLGGQIETAGEGQAVTVFNAMSWSRTDVVHLTLELPADGPRGIELRDETGAAVPFALEAAGGGEDGRPTMAMIAFVARDVPALGYRTFRAVPSPQRSRMRHGSPWTPWRSRTRLSN